LHHMAPQAGNDETGDAGHEGPPSKAAPNNYRIDRASGNLSVIARSPCDEAIQGPQHARRQQPRRSYCGPWIASLRSQ
jgi:hypothetical protein